MAEQTKVEKTTHPQDDPNAANRKRDHIELALQSQSNEPDNRFYYEPLLAAHPDTELKSFEFLDKIMKAPIWISSMTGGTEAAGKINRNLARACKEFGLGMGLGSTRKLLSSDEYFDDFNLRDIMGSDRPFYANLGIAQVEKLIAEKATDKIDALLEKLRADGLIIHVNPLQEWLQPEGDRITVPPIETIERLLGKAKYKIIVKEVGQGMGYESLRALFKLPLAAIDFAAHGGTNFSKVELLRSNKEKQQVYENLVNIGHSAADMVNMANEIIDKLGKKVQCKEVIISGGIKNFLDGFYLINKIQTKAIYGQGATLLQYAQHSYESLQTYLKAQIEGLKLANAFLKINGRVKY
jgi:isopentenyl-diphosphate delta-isomerase